MGMRWGALCAAWLLGLSSWSSGAEPLPPTEAAKQVDALLADEGTWAPGNPADDAIYLRRVALDLVGRLPTTSELEDFLLDPDPDKRSKVVQGYLADPAYGETWARYWRDVILSRRLEERALLSAQPVERYLASAFNEGRSWDAIATDFVTATGDVREEGQTAVLMAQNAQAEETAAEVARIFLGIQIQCAQCHDHPYDRWNRRQFHELAAFFPRNRVRTVMEENRRTFEVVSVDGAAAGRFGRGGRGRGEHYMSDLENPRSRGTLITPKFFVNDRTYRIGTTDEARRSTLARWMTAADNPWFAKALVNRLWYEMMGQGFYEPVDDLGPDRDATSPKTLDFLSEQFVANGYDLKWLFTTIAASEAYGRGMTQEPPPAGMVFANCPPTRLRSDQVYSNLIQALGLPPQVAAGGRGVFGGGPRNRFAQVFGFDPSAPRDEVTGSIPQALALMNSDMVNATLDGSSTRTYLGRLLRRVEDNDLVVLDLYLRTLGREPTAREMSVNLDYLQEVSRRSEAFEDIFWALLNSTEFLHRR